jgi:hypothetical protein
MKTLGWGSLPSVLLLVAGGLCLLGSLWAFGVLAPLLRWWPWSSSDDTLPHTSTAEKGPASRQQRCDAQSDRIESDLLRERPQRELIGRGEDLKRRVSMERIMIERTGRQTAQEHMLGEWTDAARSWGADAGLATEPPPIGFSPTGQPAAQRKALEDWIGKCLDTLGADS